MANNEKKINQPPDKKKCLECKNEQRISEFYKHDSPIYNDKKYPICKKCIKSKLKLNDPMSQEAIDSVKDVMLEMNKPFIFNLWVSSIEEVKKTGKKDIFGIYKKNVDQNNATATWKDSEFELTQTKTSIQEDQLQTPIKQYKTKFIITDEIMDKWGIGYTEEEYHQFEKKYVRLINNYGEKTALHTEGLLSYIRFRVKEEMSTAKGLVKDAKEWGQLASKAATDAKINVSQLSKSDISGGIDVLSQLFEAVETEVGIIPLLPRLKEQPYDDADLIIWAIINYYRRLEDKSMVPYEDIYKFYDEMLDEYFTTQGLSDDEVEEFKERRNNVFRDLGKVYKEPLYENGDL